MAMLEMINSERERVGAPAVVMGVNGAAQVHADATLEGCFSSHWGLDGTTPGMRYALAGGQQINGEIVSGHDYCIQPHENFQRIEPVEDLRMDMDGFVGSPAHLKTILDPHYRKVNLGIAWDAFNMTIVQQFEGDYVEFQQVPHLQGDSLEFEGSTENGAGAHATDGALEVAIYYHPLSPLTRGQVSHTYCLDIGLLVASLLPPPAPGYVYGDMEAVTVSYDRCVSPYDIPSTTPGSLTVWESVAQFRAGEGNGFDTGGHSPHGVDGRRPVGHGRGQLPGVRPTLARCSTSTGPGSTKCCSGEASAARQRLLPTTRCSTVYRYPKATPGNGGRWLESLFCRSPGPANGDGSAALPLASIPEPCV